MAPQQDIFEQVAAANPHLQPQNQSAPAAQPGQPSQPTQGDIFHQVAAGQTSGYDFNPPADPNAPGLLTRAGKAALEGTGELASGVGGALFETAQGVESLGKMAHIVPQSVPDIPKDLREERTPLEKVGGVAEQIGEYFVGEGEADAAIKGITKYGHLLPLMEKFPKASKMILETLKGAGVGAAQGAVKGAAEGDAAGGAKAGAEGGAVGGAAAGLTGLAAETKFVKGLINSATGGVTKTLLRY